MRAFKLSHKATGYFLFADFSSFRKRYTLSFNPDENMLHVKQQVDTTEDAAIITVKEWLQRISEEVNTPDVWAMLDSETALFTAAAVEDGQTSFSEEEQARIINGIAEIKSYVLELIDSSDATDQAIDLVTNKLQYLESAVRRLSRQDWVYMAIGVIVNIIVGTALPPEDARRLFGFVCQVISNAVPKLLS